jgi:hypothetical protein
MFLVNVLEKLSESLHFYMVYQVKIYYSNIRSKIIRIMNNFAKKIFEYWTPYQELRSNPVTNLGAFS